MTGATFDQTVEETYLCIEPGEPEDTSKPDVLSYGFKVNGATAETFKPEGWTPKLKVIEVWNKAFPKQ